MRHYSNCSTASHIDVLAESLLHGLRCELYLTPKPGLVDLSNSGSHKDLTLTLMSRSIALMQIYFSELCADLSADLSFTELVRCGQRAEKRMFDQIGSNCHKGGIFLCGLLLTAVDRCPDPLDIEALRKSIGRTAANFFRVKPAQSSHGNRIRMRRPQAGIVNEAMNGLPSLFDTFLPAMNEPGIDDHLRAFFTMAKLMQVVEDTTSLHRYGSAGLRLVQRSGWKLEQEIKAGLDPYPLLKEQDCLFRQLGLTMGGVADIMGLGFGYEIFVRRLSGGGSLDQKSDSSVVGETLTCALPE